MTRSNPSLPNTDQDLRPLPNPFGTLTLRHRTLPKHLFLQLQEVDIFSPICDLRFPILGHTTMHTSTCQHLRQDHIHVICLVNHELRTAFLIEGHLIQRQNIVEDKMKKLAEARMVLKSLDGWHPEDLPTYQFQTYCEDYFDENPYDYTPSHALVRWWAHLMKKDLPEYLLEAEHPTHNNDETMVNIVPVYYLGGSRLTGPPTLAQVQHILEENAQHLCGQPMSIEQIESNIDILSSQYDAIEENYKQALHLAQNSTHVLIGR